MINSLSLLSRALCLSGKTQETPRGDPKGTKGLATFTEVVKVRGGNLVLASDFHETFARSSLALGFFKQATHRRLGDKPFFTLGSIVH